MTDPPSHPTDPSPPLRLWTPWRMSYIAGGAKEEGCIFCNRLRADNDVASLILHRGARAFVIMNLFPYNTGHVMIVPNSHVDSPETLEPGALVEMGTLLPEVLRSSRRVLGCHGFNIGMNVGSIAGAGVAEHLHEHVVPRWNGDANFMPILGSAMVIPELIPVSYAKLRAELQRDLSGAGRASFVLVSRDRSLAGAIDGNLTTDFAIEPAKPVWRSALDRLGRPAEIAGWASSPRAGANGGIGLTLTAEPTPGDGVDWLLVEEAGSDLRQAVDNLHPVFAVEPS